MNVIGYLEKRSKDEDEDADADVHMQACRSCGVDKGVCAIQKPPDQSEDPSVNCIQNLTRFISTTAQPSPLKAEKAETRTTALNNVDDILQLTSESVTPNE